MKKKIYAIVLVLAIFIVILMPFVLQLRPMATVYPPGWEIYNQIGAVRHNDVVYDSPDDFTSPRECMGVYWKVDVDDPNYGVPTIQVQTSEIRHVDFTGKDTPPEKPADTLVVTRGNHTYYLDYHIYLMTVTIRTVADKHHYMDEGIFRKVPVFEHESSWEHEMWDSISGDLGHNQRVGKHFKGGVYVKFIISPWQGYTYRKAPNSSYVLDNCWAGVMNSYVQSIQQGGIKNQYDEDFGPNWGERVVKASLGQGHQVPMFLDDGSFGRPAPTVNWDPNVTPDVRIESSVVMYLPVEMLAGTYVTTDFLGSCVDLTVCDVYIMYTIRVDVLTTHGFILQTAHNPPGPKPPEDYFEVFYGFWDEFFKALGLANPFRMFGPWASFVAFLFTLLIAGIIILVLIAIFAPELLVMAGWMWSRRRRKG